MENKKNISKRRFYVSAIYTSKRGSMGGNTKILLEWINNLSDKYEFIIFTAEPDTFRDNLKDLSNITLIPIAYDFEKFNYISHFKEINYINKFYDEYFRTHKLHTNDYFFSCIDFAPDVLPLYNLRKKYQFKWIASMFLFIPNPIENLVKGYGFPFIKYIIYYFYQRYLFSKMLEKADLFVITNDSDKKMFPKKFQKKLFAAYGGVNTEDIKRIKDSKIEYDAVFCSRLHPQKGISQLLDIWAKVVTKVPNAKLAIMGNGDPSFETYLKDKAKRLKINKNVKWFGYVSGVEKYTTYKKSKVLVHGTIYDNNGMVAAEALCTGLPVIMYDLAPLKEVYTKGCTKVERNNKDEYAKVIVDIIENNSYKALPKKDVLLLQEYWDWETRSREFDSFLKQFWY